MLLMYLIIKFIIISFIIGKHWLLKAEPTKDDALDAIAHAMLIVSCIMLTPKTKTVHGILYIGGVEVAENGRKSTVWSIRTRHQKCNAYIDALKLMRELEEER